MDRQGAAQQARAAEKLAGRDGAHGDEQAGDGRLAVVIKGDGDPVEAEVMKRVAEAARAEADAAAEKVSAQALFFFSHPLPR